MDPVEEAVARAVIYCSYDSLGYYWSYAETSGLDGPHCEPSRERFEAFVIREIGADDEIEFRWLKCGNA